MRSIFVIMIAAGMLGAGCKSSGGAKAAEALTVLAVAGTLSAVQAAKAQRSKNRRDQTCARQCGPCEVPCGDDCLPYGSYCTRPPGKACGVTTNPDVAGARVPEPEEPDVCPVAPGFYVERTPGRSS